MMTTCASSDTITDFHPEQPVTSPVCCIPDITKQSIITVPDDNPVVRKRILFSASPPQRGFALSDGLFPILLLLAIALCILGGLYARRIPPLQQAIIPTTRKIKTEFRLTESPPKPLPPPVVKKKIPAEKKPPVDLTRKPLLRQKEEQVVTTPPEPAKKPVRKVYGLRKVYSTGLGSGGSAADAVVNKIGNTIDKDYDTITATQSDIRGTIVSTTTITTAPKFRKVVKPNYTKEMVEQKIEGTVKVKVLVDIDGKVKKATCLNDIGFDSANEAVKATMAMEFVPAMRGEDPVAVWIIVPIRFVLLG